MLRAFLLTFAAACLWVDTSCASAAVARRQQIKAMQEEQIKQVLQQQQIAAYQQAIAQRQAVQISVAQQMIGQQAVQQRIQQEIQAYIGARQIQAVQQGMIQQAVEQELMQYIAQAGVKQIQDQMIAQVVAQVVQKARNQRVDEPVSLQEVKDIVDIAQVWQKLDQKATAWTLLIDPQAKVATVEEYIARFRKEGVKINQLPAYYAQGIDDMVIQKPQLLNRPFKELLQLAAIIDYDFDNGMDKDLLVRRVLGEEGFEANKKRLGR